MAQSSKHSAWVALLLGISLGLQSVIFLAVEPQMGFTSLADFWNPDLVVPALDSTPWLVGDFCHLLNGIALLVLANMFATSDGLVTRLIRSSGAVAGGLFLLVAMFDRIGARMPELVPDPKTLSILAIGYVSTRMGALVAGVFAFGGVILLVSGENLRQRWYATWFSYIGFIVGAACVIFLLVPLPIPLLLSVWTLGLGFLLLRGGKGRT